MPQKLIILGPKKFQIQNRIVSKKNISSQEIEGPQKFQKKETFGQIFFINTYNNIVEFQYGLSVTLNLTLLFLQYPYDSTGADYKSKGGLVCLY